MPWTAKDAPKGRSGDAAKKWSEIANSVYHQCRKDHPDRPESECAALAKIVANSRTKAGGRPKPKGGYRKTVAEKLRS